MAEGVPLKLAYDLRDPNSGAVVVHDLFHIGGTWTVRALLPGYPGSTTLSDFTIQLPPPYSEEFGRYKAQYGALLNSANRGIGLKVEGYLSDVGAGSPVVSGVITKMNALLDGTWELSGSDTLYWLQQSQLFPGEEGSLLANTYRAHQIAEAMYGTRVLLHDDDFTNWGGGASYSSSGFGDSFNDVLYGAKAISANADGSYAITNATWTDDQFGAGYQLLQAASVTAWGVAVGDDTAGANTGPGAGLWLLADATGANGILAQFFLQETGAASAAYNVVAQIYSRVAGVFTLRNQVTNVFTNVPGVFPFELTAVLYTNTQPGFAPKVGVRILLNGKDTGCVFYDGIDWAIPATGRLGVRMGNLGGTCAVYFNRLRFQSRTAGWWGTSRFTVGSSYNGNFVAAAFGGQGQTHLDIIQAAAAFDGASIRKDPGAGATADKLNYGLSLGTDRSAEVVFAEGVNVVANDTALSNAAEVYSTEARINAIPFGDSGGSSTWPASVGAAGDMVLTDTVSDVGTVGFSFLTRYGRAIAARKGAPIVATQVQVVRTGGTDGILKANNGWGPRELDFIQLHLPTFGIRHQTAQIVGMTVTEGSAEATYYVTQFPEAVLPQAGFQRLVRSIDYIGTIVNR
jgi:hypothetical protein